MDAGRTGKGDVEPVEQAAEENVELVEDEPDGDETEQEALPKRFETKEDLDQYYNEALDKLGRTKAGHALTAKLPEGTSLRDVIEGDMSDQEIDELSYVAGLTQDADVDSKQVGTLVHKVAELRTLHRQPDEVLDGIRYAEQNVPKVDSEKYGEIDDVIVRGDKYYIRDYKPINLAEFEDTPEGEQWAEVMEQRLGADFRDQIKGGHSPFVQDMPKEVRESMRDFLADKTEEHHKQLEDYKAAFVAAHPKATSELTHTSVRPYFVYR